MSNFFLSIGLVSVVTVINAWSTIADKSEHCMDEYDI